MDLNLDDKHTALFGVFDGHAGKEVAAYCARHIVSPAADGDMPVAVASNWQQTDTARQCHTQGVCVNRMPNHGTWCR